jgi:hypothetical protein
VRVEAAVVGLLLLLPCGAQAAGGHHAVDDAATLDPGRCHAEAWVERDVHAEGHLFQFGPACRIGATEWGLGLERSELAEFDTSRVTLQGKTVWAQPRPALGLALTAGLAQTLEPSSTTAVYAVLPATWAATDALLLHLNLGVHYSEAGHFDSRYGAALEAAFSERWSGVAEWFGAEHYQFAQAGLRLAAAEGLSLDLSFARAIRNAHREWATLGFTLEFDR